VDDASMWRLKRGHCPIYGPIPYASEQGIYLGLTRELNRVIRELIRLIRESLDLTRIM
jgi:hypothetical protein